MNVGREGEEVLGSMEGEWDVVETEKSMYGKWRVCNETGKEQR